MPNYNKIKVLRFMAQLLHPNAVIDISYFTLTQNFWDRLVEIGSSQLVLPAIYGSLKRKNLDIHAPKDLISYLQKISSLNYERNAAILKQIDFLSKIFNKHQIEHVFLKGAAILIAKPYDALNERMIGDIDVLIPEKDIVRAQKLLINNRFKAVSKDYDFTKNLDFAKHLDRIVHPKFIAAVEIHRKLLDLTLKKSILSEDVLKEKIQNSKGYFFPSKKHLWQHAILNWQYNDNGIIQNSLGFRSVLDSLYLEPNDIVEKIKFSSKAIKHFYSLLSIYYDTYPTYYPLMKLRYKWTLKYKIINIINRVYFKLRFFMNIGRIRFSSSIYRKRVLNNPKIFIQRIFDFWNK